jgi:hypothetical protein
MSLPGPRPTSGLREAWSARIFQIPAAASRDRNRNQDSSHKHPSSSGDLLNFPGPAPLSRGPLFHQGIGRIIDRAPGRKQTIPPGQVAEPPRGGQPKPEIDLIIPLPSRPPREDAKTVHTLDCSQILYAVMAGISPRCRPVRDSSQVASIALCDVTTQETGLHPSLRTGSGVPSVWIRDGRAKHFPSGPSAAAWGSTPDKKYVPTNTAALDQRQ